MKPLVEIPKPCLEGIVMQRRNIGKNLKKVRLQNNLSWAKVAEMAGMRNMQVKYMEEGERAFTVDNLLKLCHVYEISLKDLID